MVKNKVPIETIASILGRSTPDTTDIYITTDPEKRKNEYFQWVASQRK